MSSIEKWLAKNTTSLKGKTVAITGSTGALGRELCTYLATLGASLVLIDRNAARGNAFCKELSVRFPDVTVSSICADLANVASVKEAAIQLCACSVDVFIHNAGAYAIPRCKCATGLDNVFQINFLSPYYLINTLLPHLRERRGRVVIVSSIAHNYSESDPCDVDFSTRQRASLVYGNAKRHLTFALAELFRNETEVALSITHPGISFTGITAHYPKLIFALIKYPMKLIFMKPKKACLSTLQGVFESTGPDAWIGPRILDIWGLPRKKPLCSAKKEERAQIFARAESLYEAMKE